ncbi:hypothetical protein ARSEF4850_007408 [Beauveria asiatica]
MSSTRPELEVVEYHHYFPHGVYRILASGASAFIGQVDDSTVLKYPLERFGDASRLEHEHQLLHIVGHHDRIIAQKDLTGDGLYFEYAANGSILDFLLEPEHATITLQQRRVIHCDINPTNILLDENLDIELADFQGCHVAENGELLLPALVGEPCRYFCPREDEFEANQETDLFAPGSTIHFIVTGEEVFSDIIPGGYGWDDKVKSRFTGGAFPNDKHACSSIARKCWTRHYKSASEVLQDIRQVEQLHTV